MRSLILVSCRQLADGRLIRRYFGTYTHAEMASSLLSSTGSTQELLSRNPAQNLSSLYHIYATGMEGLFSYGDTGPNKYTSTANGLLFYGPQFSKQAVSKPEPLI